MLLLTSSLASSCSSTSESQIDPQTGMSRLMCPVFSDLLEEANTEVWKLTEFKTSVTSAQRAVLEVMGDAATIAAITNEPATSWLRDIGENGEDFFRFFDTSNEGSTEELVQIYSRWKTNYEALSKYCP